MSVVAVKKEENQFYISADSICISGYTQDKQPDIKIKFINEKFIFGSAGTAREIALFSIYCKTHQPKNADEESILDYIVEFIN